MIINHHSFTTKRFYYNKFSPSVCFRIIKTSIMSAAHIFSDNRNLILSQKRYITDTRYGDYRISDRAAYFSSVHTRVIPNLDYFSKSQYDQLLSDKKIQSYFKSVRKMVEYPGLLDKFKRSGFDTSLAEQIITENTDVKARYNSTVSSCHSIISDRNLSNLGKSISFEEYEFLGHRYLIDVLPHHNLENFKKPTTDQVLNQLNLRASQGLPDPRVKKRDIVPDLRVILTQFLNGKLKPTDILLYPTATFLRLQIRASGLKTRVVHAVQAHISVLESYYYLWFVSGIPLDSCLKIGLTQLQISEFVSSFKDYYCYCDDYSQWDSYRRREVSIISFELLSRSLKLSRYTSKIFKFLRNYYLSVPMFHPIIGFSQRWLGTVSGSGFTSLDNSQCNWIVFTVSLFRYCKKYNIDPYTFEYKVGVLGDDLIYGTKVYLNARALREIASSGFGVAMREELKCQPPGIDKGFFLGSLWLEGKPYRLEKLMVASVVLGTGNFPEMSTYELLTSRFLQVFGNSADCQQKWKRLRIGPIPKRVFEFQELLVYRDNTRRSSPKSDIGRGEWKDISVSMSDLSNLWTTR